MHTYLANRYWGKLEELCNRISIITWHEGSVLAYVTSETLLRFRDIPISIFIWCHASTTRSPRILLNSGDHNIYLYTWLQKAINNFSYLTGKNWDKNLHTFRFPYFRMKSSESRIKNSDWNHKIAWTKQSHNSLGSSIFWMSIMSHLRGYVVVLTQIWFLISTSEPDSDHGFQLQEFIQLSFQETVGNNRTDIMR